MEDLKRLGFEIGDLGFWVRVRETNEREVPDIHNTGRGGCINGGGVLGIYTRETKLLHGVKLVGPLAGSVAGRSHLLPSPLPWCFATQRSLSSPPTDSSANTTHHQFTAAASPRESRSVPPSTADQPPCSSSPVCWATFGYWICGRFSEA
ncbi:hypothetical protein RHGRI_018155 [Rhododendron griersonianum]|uniref:Uncharacterized protein n=1 Tax=Rhododendron griersonianum TaxID=479676 RepID=A0AAV6K0H7_9ERIC|nr:hypothetical protein RHGRI_018155 [Rhododendron griersonianum]